VNQYREGKAKRTPARGVKKNLKPCTYKQWEHFYVFEQTALTFIAPAAPIASLTDVRTQSEQLSPLKAEDPMMFEAEVRQSVRMGFLCLPHWFNAMYPIHTTIAPARMRLSAELVANFCSSRVQLSSPEVVRDRLTAMASRMSGTNVDRFAALNEDPRGASVYLNSTVAAFLVVRSSQEAVYSAGFLRAPASGLAEW